LITSHQQALRWLLEEAARWHVANGAPETVDELFVQYVARYEDDEKFRAEADAAAQQALDEVVTVLDDLGIARRLGHGEYDVTRH
jgi:hypothetical protein